MRSASAPNNFLRMLGILALMAMLSACGGGGGGGSTTQTSSSYPATSGVAQKGPLILGSTVTVQELSENLEPTGKQYTYQINSDLGTFSINTTFGSRYVGINATGYYFDEVTNTVSSGPVTLNGISDLSSGTGMNVNLLTTLAYQRIKNLVAKNGLSFAAAKSQAESEVLAAFNVPNPGAYGNFGTLDLGKETDGNHILAAISSEFSYGNTAGNLNALIASVQNDIGNNGAITNTATRTTLAASAKSLNPASVAANLNQKYATSGVAYTASSISDWLDQSGDGVLGKFEFLVSNATQSSSFALPVLVTNSFAGSTISASPGQLSVNGSPTSGPVVLKTGDTLVVSPPAGVFPDGTLNVYLLAGSTRVAKVTFVKGLSSLAVTPANPSLPIGATQQFTATGTFTDNSTADLTSSATWTSGAPASASINATTGLAKALAVGSTNISATTGGVSGTASLNVVAATLQSISVTPNPTSTGVGIARPITATGSYSDGSQRDLTASVTWTTLAPSIATVSGGWVTGHALGSTTISATSGAISGSGVLTVTANGWSPTANFLSSSITPSTATLLQNGKVLVAGGSGLLGDGEIFDQSTNSWSYCGWPLGGKQGMSATLLTSGKVLFAGGIYHTLSSDTVPSLYDPTANTWGLGASMLAFRNRHTATLLSNGKVLLAGGSGTSGFSVPSAEIYDPGTNTWTAAGNMITPRSDHQATALANGKILVTGGLNQSGQDIQSAEIYDPGTNTWTAAGNMTTARDSHNATLLANGKVLVSGGQMTFPTYSTPLSSAEIYDPGTNTWSSAANMTTARTGSTAARLANGTVLVAGGQATQASTSALSSAEIYDPTSNSWSLTASMSVARYKPTATMLPGGSLLVCSGNINCELYW